MNFDFLNLDTVDTVTIDGVKAYLQSKISSLKVEMKGLRRDLEVAIEKADGVEMPEAELKVKECHVEKAEKDYHETVAKAVDVLTTSKSNAYETLIRAFSDRTPSKIVLAILDLNHYENMTPEDYKSVKVAKDYYDLMVECFEKGETYEVVTPKQLRKVENLENSISTLQQEITDLEACLDAFDVV